MRVLTLQWIILAMKWLFLMLKAMSHFNYFLKFFSFDASPEQPAHFTIQFTEGAKFVQDGAQPHVMTFSNTTYRNIKEED